MRIAVEISEADAEFLDDIGREIGIDSRDAMIGRAVEILRQFVNNNGLFLLTPVQWEATHR